MRVYWLLGVHLGRPYVKAVSHMVLTWRVETEGRRPARGSGGGKGVRVECLEFRV